MKKILFGDAGYAGISKTPKIEFKNMIVDATTSQDGRSVEWRTLGFKAIQTLVNGAVAASSTVVLDSTTGISPGDCLRIRDATNGYQYGYVASVTNATTLVLGANITIADNAQVVRISYSKGVGKEIDRVDYDLTWKTQSNYFQDFGAKKSFTLEKINSHIDVPSSILMMQNPQKNLKTSNEEKAIDTIVNNYLQLEFGRKIGSDIIGDVMRQFLVGQKATNTINSKTRYYAGGLFDCITTSDTISAAGTDEAKLKSIFDVVYDVLNLSAMLGNTKVVILANNAFAKEYAKYTLSNVNLSNFPSVVGFQADTILLPGGVEVGIEYESMLDIVEPDNKAVAYVLPLDLISAKTRKWIDVDNMKALSHGPADIKLVKAISSQDTLDTIDYLFYYVATFIFGGLGEAEVYRRIVIE